MKPFTFILATLALASALAAQTITVAAAANLKFAMDDLARAFTKETSIEVKPVFGASGKLTQQIMSGAPYDAFLSADVEFPAKLAQGGYTTTPAQVYAYGSLVLWSNTGADLSQGLRSVANQKIAKIAIANPKTAPYGIEAMNALRYAKMDSLAIPKLVTAESVSQVGNYVTTKAADIGFIAKSIVLSPEMKNVGAWVDIDPKAYNRVDQAMVGLKNVPPENQIAAKKFLDFMGSSKAQTILKANGYLVPPNK